ARLRVQRRAQPPDDQGALGPRRREGPMSGKAGFARSRFARGTDRRAAGRTHAPDRRNAPQDRRRRNLGWLALFRGTDLAAAAQAVGHCDVIEVPAGTPLLRPGEENDTVYVLLVGRVAAYLDSAAAAHNAIVIPPGECIGELSAID